MSLQASDYTYCPDCKRKGVTLRLQNNGEDHLGCRYCDWSAFTSEAYPQYKADQENLRRHAEWNQTERARLCQGCGLRHSPARGAVTAFLNGYWHRACFAHAGSPLTPRREIP